MGTIKDKAETERKYTVDEAAVHPFTGLYWDYTTESYMFLICGKLIVQLDLAGNVIPAVEKRSVGR